MSQLSAAKAAALRGSLRSSGWLSRTSPEFQQALLSRVVWRRLKRGESAMHEGDEVGGMFGVAEGSVAIIVASANSELPFLHLAGCGFWFGTNPLVAGAPRLATVAARTPVLLAHAPRAALEQMLAERPQWWRPLMLQSNETLGLTMHALADMGTRDPETRCLLVLLRLAGQRFPDAPTVPRAEAAITQDELAAVTNLSRSTVCDIVRNLAARGIVELGYRKITLVNPAQLRDRLVA